MSLTVRPINLIYIFLTVPLPLPQISEIYGIPISDVENIILLKSLHTDRCISEFFAANSAKIMEFASQGAISSIVEEEFRELPSFSFFEVPST